MSPTKRPRSWVAAPWPVVGANQREPRTKDTRTYRSKSEFDTEGESEVLVRRLPGPVGRQARGYGPPPPHRMGTRTGPDARRGSCSRRPDALTCRPEWLA
jgi:hypothetical protein